ncbi:hypothetical protein GPECTOR_30g195 [Gonium pectorale]|uniref:SET domain-containing protein n=1 Tax=Gonium pectorale TaxID=33097 RepID=A0A150GFI9_GONPE|nr:hypothetical protein GPECTOR_30g195 [Gonium pectorale]|eukprot:KXZ48100.1 hypothetical protein GPECTOR_30g195 [Gonium pectorale]
MEAPVTIVWRDACLRLPPEAVVLLAGRQNGITQCIGKPYALVASAGASAGSNERQFSGLRLHRDKDGAWWLSGAEELVAHLLGPSVTSPAELLLFRMADGRPAVARPPKAESGAEAHDEPPGDRPHSVEGATGGWRPVVAADASRAVATGGSQLGMGGGDTKASGSNGAATRDNSSSGGGSDDDSAQSSVGTSDDDTSVPGSDDEEYVPDSAPATDLDPEEEEGPSSGADSEPRGGASTEQRAGGGRRGGSKNGGAGRGGSGSRDAGGAHRCFKVLWARSAVWLPIEVARATYPEETADLEQDGAGGRNAQGGGVFLPVQVEYVATRGELCNCSKTAKFQLAKGRFTLREARAVARALGAKEKDYLRLVVQPGRTPRLERLTEEEQAEARLGVKFRAGRQLPRKPAVQADAGAGGEAAVPPLRRQTPAENIVRQSYDVLHGTAAIRSCYPREAQAALEQLKAQAAVLYIRSPDGGQGLEPFRVSVAPHSRGSYPSYVRILPGAELLRELGIVGQCRRLRLQVLKPGCGGNGDGSGSGNGRPSAAGGGANGQGRAAGATRVVAELLPESEGEGVAPKRNKGGVKARRAPAEQRPDAVSAQRGRRWRRAADARSGVVPDDDGSLAQRLVRPSPDQPLGQMVKLGGKRIPAGGAVWPDAGTRGAGVEGPQDAAADAPGTPVAADVPDLGCHGQHQAAVAAWADSPEAAVSARDMIISPLQPAAAPTATLPTSAQQQPAASIAHLHGYVPPSVGLPPLQPGQVRVCGLTFDTALAPAVASAQAAWQQRLGRDLRYADPTRDQLACVGLSFPQSLSRAVVCNKLARLLGIDGRPHAPMPEGPVVLEGAMQPCGDPTRGGAGLQAAAALKKNTVLGVVGGYVMPAGAAEDFVNFGHKHCRPEMAERLAEVVAGTGADAATAWRLLAGAFRMSLPAEAALEPVHGSSDAASPVELSTLGYGTLMALVNDPRLNPRDWAPGNDVDSQEAAERANCEVVPVSVRGLVLPVLVALRDIAPGDQLLRDYGAGWWRQLAPDWEVAEHDGLDVARLLHGTQQQPAQDAQPDPLSPAPQPDEAPAAVVAAQQLLARHGLPYAKGAVLRVKWARGFKLRLGHVVSKTGPPKWGDVRVTGHFGELLDDLAAAEKDDKHELTLWVYSLTTLAPTLELELDPTSLGPGVAAQAATRLRQGGDGGGGGSNVCVPLHEGVRDMYGLIRKRSGAGGAGNGAGGVVSSGSSTDSSSGAGEDGGAWGAGGTAEDALGRNVCR